jgi:hypothetical protein
MNTASKISNQLGTRTPDMSIDWEIQPSLQHLVVRTDGAAPGWAETMPAEFDAIEEPVTFREPLEGLSMRDLNEPEIFRLFFGEAQAATASGARA